MAEFISRKKCLQALQPINRSFEPRVDRGFEADLESFKEPVTIKKTK